MSNALGWVQVPVVPVFNGIKSKLEAELVKPAEQSSKKAGDAIQKNIASGTDAAAKQVEKANYRVKKSAEELADAEAKRNAEAKKAEAAAKLLAASEGKLADMKKSGSASAEQLAKAEADVLTKRAKADTAAHNLEKAERGVEKATTESARAADSLTAAQKILDQATEESADSAKRYGDAVESAGASSRSFEDQLGKIAAAGTAAAGVVAAAGKAAYEIGVSFDDAYDTIRIGTGASGEAFEGLQQSMRNVAKNSIGVGADLGEIGTTLADLNTRLGVTGEPLEKLTAQFQQLKGMGMDVDINAITGAFTQFGVEVDQMPGMMDKLFQISQATGRGMTDLVANLEKSGPALQQFGFNLEESAGLLGALDKAGLDSEKTLGSMTKALGEFAKEGKNPQEALWGTIQKIDELTRAGKSAEAIDLANSIFGAKGGAGFVAAVESGQFAYDDFMESLGASSDTINGLAEETADFAERWDMFKVNAMLAIEPVAMMIFDTLAPAMEKLAGFISEHPKLFAAAAGAVTAFAAGLSGLVAVGVVTKNIKELSGILEMAKGLTNATKGLQGISKILGGLKLNPWIAGITAAVAALTWFFTKTELGQKIWSEFMDSLRAAGEWISSTLGPMFTALGDAIVGTFTWVRDKVGGFFEWIGEKVAWVKEYVSELMNFWSTGDTSGIADMLGLDQEGFILQTFETIRNAIVFLKDAATAAWQWMGEKWSEFAQGIRTPYDSFITPLWETFKAAASALGDVLTAIWQRIADGARIMWDAVSAVFTLFLNGWRALVDAIANSPVIQVVWLGLQTAAQVLWTVLSGIFENIKIGFRLVGEVMQSVYQNIISPVFGFFRQAAGLLADVLTGNFDNIKNRFQAMGEHLRSVVMGPINVAMDACKAAVRATSRVFENFKDTVGKVVQSVKQKMNEMVAVLRQIPRQIGSIFANAGQWLVNAGKNVIQGFINGISSMAGKIGNAITSIMPSSIGGLIGFSGGGSVPAYSSGGRLPSEPGSGLLPRIPGIPRSVRDPIIGFNRVGLPIARIEPEEFIVNRKDTAANLPLLRAINSGAKIIWQAVTDGRSGGPEVSGGGLPAYQGGGVIQPMINVVKKKYPMMTVTSTVRSGDRGYHGAGLAVDFSNGAGNTPQMLALARDIAATYPNSLELIYDAPGFDKTIKNGKVVGRFGQYYTMAQAGPHHHHVHWAINTPPSRDLGSGAASSGGGQQVVKQGPANLPPMKWSEKMLTVNAIRAGRAVALQFPQVKTIGGYRPYDPYPDHPSGRALDIMTYTDKALGDRILNFLFDHPDFFKMQYAIWQKAMWYKKGAPQPMADRGSPTQNHMDHVHAYFHPSPRATGNEIYPNTIGAGGGGGAKTIAMGDANLPLQINTGAPGEAAGVSKTIDLPNVDYGTASQLATKYDTEKHRNESLREFIKRARVFDTGGILPTGGIAVNLGKPELIFPAEATTAMLQMARKTPQFAQAMDVLSKHVPPLAAAIDKLTDLDYGMIAQEIGGAINGTDLGYGELARMVGDEAAEKIVTKLGFIAAQIRDIQDGSNIRAYLSSMRGTEALGLIDRVGQMVGIGGQAGQMFGGVVKGFEALEDAAVQQVDAANAVKQAEDNLASARKQYAEMLAESGANPDVSTQTARKIEDAERKLKEAKEAPRSKSDTDGSAQAKKIEDAERNLARVREDASKELEKSGAKNADDLVKAAEAVTAAENERTKALGVVKMAAVATGQAQVSMALDALEMVIGIGKWIKNLVDRIRQSYVDAKKALVTGMAEIAKWAELVHEWQTSVATLQQQLVRGLNEQRDAERALRIATHDRMIKVANAEIDLARARLDLDKEIKRGAMIAQLKLMGLHEDWDSYMAYQALVATGVLEEWSDEAISKLYRYEAARAKAAKAELEGRLDQIKAEAALAAAARQNARTQADLIQAQERLIKMSAKVAGVDLVEATGGAQLAKLFAQLAEVQRGIEDDWKGHGGYVLKAKGKHANEYRGRLAQRASIQASIDAVLAETGISMKGVDYDKMLKQMAYVQRHGGDPLNVARTLMPRLAQAEAVMLRSESLKPIWDAQDKLTNDNRVVEDFLAEIDLYSKSTPLEETIKALDYTIQGLDDSAEAWADGNKELRGEYLNSARANQRAAESLGVNWKIDDAYATGNVRDRIQKETTIHLDGEKMYTADQIDQLLAEVTAGTNSSYRIVRSASEVAVARRKERV